MNSHYMLHQCIYINVTICFCHFPVSYNKPNREHPQTLWNSLHTHGNIYGSHGCQSDIHRVLWEKLWMQFKWFPTSFSVLFYEIWGSRGGAYEDYFLWDMALSNSVILYQSFGGTQIPTHRKQAYPGWRTGTYVSLNMGT